MGCSKSLRRLLCCVSPQSCTDSIEVNLFDSIPLPQDILIQILLLLPFKSVLDCKLVSKQLKNLIDDPMFSNAYSENSPTSLILINSTLYFTRIRQQGKKKKFVNDPIPPFTMRRIPVEFKIKNVKPEASYAVLDGPEEFKIKNVKPEASNYNLLIGLSKTVACVQAGNGDFLIYNSFTGASYAVWDGPEEQSFVCSGFGYDPCDDDHNIFVACKLGKFWVYTLRNKVWKSFQDFPYADYDWKSLRWTYPERDRGYSFSGALHWLVFTTSGGEESPKEVIVTYDMHTRRFGEILLPLANERDKTSHTTTFLELNGHLCYSYHNCYDASKILKLEMWVMKEYGIVDSWEKFVSIDCCSEELVGILSWSPRVPLLYQQQDGGNLVMLACHTADILVWYDVDKNKVVTMSVKKKRARPKMF